ncbi:MAG: DUF3857 domain-containing protein [Saprospiraceae bacterium]
MKSTFILLCALLCVRYSLFAQKPTKWGDIPRSDLQMTRYEVDTTASAVVLQDVGSLEFIETSQNFILVFSQHRRIKVFDQNAFKEGNIFIPYFSGWGVEKFQDLDVQVFAPDGTKTKVRTDNIFTEKLTRNWSAKKIFIPNLQKGSVLEYRLRIETENWRTPREWYFQDADLPTRWSEFTFEAPEFFQYVTIRKGGSQYDVNEKSTRTAHLGGSEQTYLYQITRLGRANMPALKPEPYVTTIDDYRSSVKYQLRAFVPPLSAPVPILTSWPELASNLANDGQLGQQYLRPNKSDRLWAAYKAAAGNVAPEQTVAQVLKFVSSNIIWDGNYSIFTQSSIDEAFSKRSGNLAEVNLAVIALLHRLDINAYPMLLSTRSNGICHPEYPILDQFNALVVFIPDPAGGEGGTILDASSPHHAAGLAMEEAYNGEGWVLQTPTPRWVYFNPPESAEAFIADLSLREDGSFDGRFKLQMTNHIACYYREELSDNPEGSFIKSLFSDKYPDAVIDSIQIENKNNPELPLKIEFKARFPNAAQTANEFMYCAPVCAFFIDENPFKSQKRLYPVNFPYPFRAQYILTLHLPSGYVVEELPAGANLVLPNDGGKILYNASAASPQTLSVNLKFSLKQLDFMPEEYGTVRMFFDQLGSKIEEQIVLKKS